MTVKKAGHGKRDKVPLPPSPPPHPPQNSAKSMRDEGRQRLGIRFRERKKEKSIKKIGKNLQ
jgi:hypothetical protein